jgi:hypothetical protein
MISQTLTVTRANRPIFVSPQGLDLAFSKVLWVLINPLGNFFSDVGTGIVNTVQRISNFAKGDGFSTNKQVVLNELSKLDGADYVNAAKTALQSGKISMSELPYAVEHVDSARTAKFNDVEDILKQRYVLTSGPETTQFIDSLPLSDAEKKVYKKKLTGWQSDWKNASRQQKAAWTAEYGQKQNEMFKDMRENPDAYNWLWTQKSQAGINFINLKVKNPFVDPNSMIINISNPFAKRSDKFHQGVDGGTGGFYLPVDAEYTGGTVGEQRSIGGNTRGVWFDGKDVVNFKPGEFPSTESYSGSDRNDLAANKRALSAYGNSAEFKTTIDGVDYFMTFMHMNEKPTQFQKGHKYSASTQVGTIGSTGRSTGPHGHFEVHVVNEPVSLSKDLYVRTKGNYYIDPIYFLNKIAAGR